MTQPLHSDQRSEQVTVHAVGRTDVGNTREHNEDSFLLIDLESGNWGSSAGGDTAAISGGQGMMLAVADGLGGAAAGEIASRMALEILRDEMERVWAANGRPQLDEVARALAATVSTANARLHAFAKENPEHKGMGTTITAAVLHGDTLLVAQIGDSRAYIVRDGVAEQITKDQSLMQRLIEAGELTPEEAEKSERRNIILQALGPEALVRVDLTQQRVRRGDRLVLCTDGLSGVVGRDELAAVVSSRDDLSRMTEQLIDRANAAGGPDNITVVIGAFEGPGLTDAESDDRVGYTVFPLSDGEATPVRAHARYVERTTGPMPAVGDEEYASIAFPRDPQASLNRALLLAVGLTVLAALVLLALRQLRTDEDAPAADAPVEVTVPWSSG